MIRRIFFLLFLDTHDSGMKDDNHSPRIIVTNEFGLSLEFEKQTDDFIDMGYTPAIEHYIDVFSRLDVDAINSKFSSGTVLLYDSVYNKKTGVCAYYILENLRAEEITYSKIRLLPGADVGDYLFNKNLCDIYEVNARKMRDSYLFNQGNYGSINDVITSKLVLNNAFLDTKTTQINNTKVRFLVLLTFKKAKLSKSKRIFTEVASNNTKIHCIS